MLSKLQQNVSGVAAFASLRYIGIEQLSHAPTYDAYREFAAGMDLFGGDYATAIKHFERSAAIDPEHASEEIARTVTSSRSRG